jgi:hypothetical protein
LSLAGVALVLGVQLLGYTIFRGANGQKDAFRRDPTDPAVAHLKTLATKRGTKLIVSGWRVPAPLMLASFARSHALAISSPTPPSILCPFEPSETPLKNPLKPSELAKT